MPGRKQQLENTNLKDKPLRTGAAKRASLHARIRFKATARTIALI